MSTRNDVKLQKEAADPRKWTTLRVTQETADMIKQKMRFGDNNADDVLFKILNGEADVMFDFISIDGEGPLTSPHEIVFCLGENKPPHLKPHYYEFKKGVISPIDKPPRMIRVDQ